MLEDSRESRGPDRGWERSERSKPGKLDSPSRFVAELLNYLTSSEDYQGGPLATARERLLAEMRAKGVHTPRELASLVDSLQDLRAIRVLTEVYSKLYEFSSAEELVQSLPALVSLVHASLMASESPSDPHTDADGTNGCALEDIIYTVLEALKEDQSFAPIAGQGITDRERELLLQVASTAPVDRAGYLGAMEMLWDFCPDTYSLKILVNTLGRIPTLAGVREMAVKEMAVRRVSEFARHDFENSFRFLALALCDSRETKLAPRVDAVAEGFGTNAAEHVDFLVSMIKSEELGLRILASKVIIFAGRQSEDGRSNREPLLTQAGLVTLAGGIRAAYLADPHDSVDLSKQLVLAALASISSTQGDVHLAIQEMQAILRTTIPSPELCESLVRGAQRVHKVKPIVCFEQLDVPCEHRLSLVAWEINHIDDEHFLATTAQIDYEHLALKVARAGSFEEVLDICRLYACPNYYYEAVPRPPQSLALFGELDEAESFLIWYRELCEAGPHRFAIELFPEFLSAFACFGVGPDEGDQHVAGAMRSLSTILVNRPDYPRLASSRLNVHDIGFLSGLSREYNGLRWTTEGVDLILASYELQAALEGAIPGARLHWQKELVEFWCKLPPSVTSQVHSDVLARISAISEMRAKGSALGLLKMVPIRETFNRWLFSAFAHGLTLRPTGVATTILELVDSESGYDRARGFFLSQLLPCYLEESQGNHILTVARSSLSEPGALSLDAMCTIGALSSSPADAIRLLKSEPSIGVDRSLHDATAVAAAEQILRGARHINGGYQSRI